MKITKIEIDNFRSIESITVPFPGHYTAISGKNNSGKSNLLRPLRLLFEAEQRFRFDEEAIVHSAYFPIWKKADANDPIRIKVGLSLSRSLDASVFKLVADFFKITEETHDIEILLTASFAAEKDQPDYFAEVGGETLDSYKSRTIFTTIKTSGAFQFYNSTEPNNPFDSRNHLTDLVGKLSKADRDEIVKNRDKLSKTVATLAQKHQKDLSELLGRLEEKYSVSLSAPKLNVEYLPINITLGDKKFDVSLDEWGSGTKNRTHILLSLFRAKKMTESPDDDAKIGPVLIIEEPESFLHPSAQAEFGRLIQDLSEEFKVQVIVATHSPYFLSQQRPESNVLLCRRAEGGKFKGTDLVAIDQDNWMEPFAQNLGMANPEFMPWKNIIFSSTNKILLVEGEIDKEYFEMLRSQDHGDKRLTFDGEIYPYGGLGTLQNGVLLRFIKGRYQKFFLTFDLDGEGALTKLLSSLKMEKGTNYCSIGLPGGGKDKIEGLLPESVKNTVFGANGDLVQSALAGTGEEAKSAKQRLKKLQLEEFKRQAKPGEEFYGGFYKLTKIINKALQ